MADLMISLQMFVFLQILRDYSLNLYAHTLKKITHYNHSFSHYLRSEQILYLNQHPHLLDLFFCWKFSKELQGSMGTGQHSLL